MKSTLINMVAVLFVITLVASAGVGYIYQLTADPIAQANKQAEQEALLQVLPEFDATTVEALTIDQLPIEVNVATKQGEVVGYAVKSQTNSGFGGNIVMMVGFDTAGTILNVNVLKQAETPGLGTKMAEPGNVLLLSVQGKNPAQMNLAVKKDGGDVDALTAATISSRAYVEAIKRATEAYNQVAVSAVQLDAVTAATQTQEGEAYMSEAQEGGQNE